jgi:signal transduction histidine kinase
MSNELKDLNSEKDKFFLFFFHDIRGPFHGFLGFIELMADSSQSMTTEEIQENIIRLKGSATNLYNLLENLLEWSSMQRQLTVFNPKIIQLAPKIYDCLAILQEAGRLKEIAIISEVPEDTVVFSDENMLGGILRNLISNAIKFTCKGGKISISSREISSNFVEITVSDTGIGMNHEMVANLFKISINTSRKGTEGEPSTGLGLFIFKDFVEKHGGRISVESEEGKGSKFKFTIPAISDRNR